MGLRTIQHDNRKIWIFRNIFVDAVLVISYSMIISSVKSTIQSVRKITPKCSGDTICCLRGPSTCSAVSPVIVFLYPALDRSCVPFISPPPARDLLGEEVSGFPATKNVCFDFQMPREHDDGTQTLRHRNSDPIIILRVSPQTPLKLLTCNVRSFSSSRYVRRLESPLPHAVQKSHFSKTISKLIQA
jgi:hypothetical protein